MDLIATYHDTVVLNVNGHTHMHELHLIRKEGAPVQDAVLSLNVPSISPVVMNLPAFGVLTIQSKDLKIQDLKIYSLDPAGTVRVSSFDEDYSQTEFSSVSVNTVLTALGMDSDVRARYEANFMTGSSVKNPVFNDWKLFLCSTLHLDLEGYQACAH